jgi:hypothetical protein
MGRFEETSVQTVADLIDEESGDWNEQGMRQVFFMPDAETILCMSRPRISREDI